LLAGTGSRETFFHIFYENSVDNQDTLYRCIMILPFRYRQSRLSVLLKAFYLKKIISEIWENPSGTFPSALFVFIPRSFVVLSFYLDTDLKINPALA